MTVNPRVLKVLWGRAAGLCGFPGCEQQLAESVQTLLGEVAHIVAQSPDGPRGQMTAPGGDLDGYENLILLCEAHHKTVDSQPATYTVARLVQMRADHEERVARLLGREQRYVWVHPEHAAVTEEVHSTLLPVIAMPLRVYTAKCAFDEQRVKSEFEYPAGSSDMYPFAIRADMLIAFNDLRDTKSPFRKFVDSDSVQAQDAAMWWGDPDRLRWYVTLLNRTLNKLTGRRHLNLDKEHDRYFFELLEEGKPRSVRYRSLTGTKTSRQVVWRPMFRHSGEPKSYWEHMAVGLRFHRVAERSWCMSIRPERRFTRDGHIPLTPKGTGRRSTSRKSHMYNIDVLTEVNFWREFLSDSSPRVIMRFGPQSLIVDTRIMSVRATWPGVPDDARAVTFTRAEDDLFTSAEFDALLRSAQEDGDDWEQIEEAPEE